MQDDLLGDILRAADVHRGREAGPRLDAVLSRVTTLAPADREAIIDGLVEGLGQIASPTGAGLVAVWLGALVERGADPQRALPALVAAFRSRLAAFAAGDGAGTAALADGLEWLAQALVAHLVRCPDACERLRGDAALVDALAAVEYESLGAAWVLQVLRQDSGTLLVLHGRELAGARVDYANIANCFHLFTLLQAALQDVMPGARRAAADVVAGAVDQAGERVTDTAWWHFGPATEPAPGPGAMIPGEAPPRAIPEVDGERIILLWPPLPEARSWDSGFFWPLIEARRPSVTLRERLDSDEVLQWRRRLGLPPPRRRWQFWRR